MIQIKLQNKTFFIPSKWEDVSAELILKLSKFALADTPSNRIEVMKIMIPQNVKALFFLLQKEQVYSLTSLLDWVYQTSFDWPMIPSFKSNDGVTFVCPEKFLRKCSIIEYTYADKYYEAVVNGDSSKIDYLILALCRPKRKDKIKEDEWDGDVRERFNPVLIEERVQRITNLSLEFKLYFLLFFMGCKQSLAKKYSPLFRQRDDGEDNNDTKSPNFGWVGVIWELSDGIVNEEKVQFTNLHNIMAYLCKKHYDNQATLKKQNQNGLS